MINLYITRYGVMRLLGVFSYEGTPLTARTSVIIRTNRGLEAGIVLGIATEEQIAKYPSSDHENRILREMTKEDAAEQRRIQLEEKKRISTLSTDHSTNEDFDESCANRTSFWWRTDHRLLRCGGSCRLSRIGESARFRISDPN